MTLTYSLLSQAGIKRTVGRGVVFGADVWDTTSDLTLTHLGDTEGPITGSREGQYSDLTLPELTGSALHERFYEGENPVLELPFYVTTRALEELFSPTENASAGYSRRRPVFEKTIVVFPEMLFWDPVNFNFDSDLTYTTPTGWQLGGQALTSEQNRLLELSLWLWRCHLVRPDLNFQNEDAGKNVGTVSVQVLQQTLLPEGEQLYTRGDPETRLIWIEPSTS